MNILYIDIQLFKFSIALVLKNKHYKSNNKYNLKHNNIKTFRHHTVHYSSMFNLNF
jgi:hypothetical protein